MVRSQLRSCSTVTRDNGLGPLLGVKVSGRSLTNSSTLHSFFFNCNWSNITRVHRRGNYCNSF